MLTVGVYPEGVYPEDVLRRGADRKCAIRTFHYLTLRDGKIVSGEAMMDWMSMLSQIGIMPPPEEMRAFLQRAGELKPRKWDK